MNALRRTTPWRKTVFSFILLGTALALFYAVVDWRAARAWAECQRALKSRGEVLNFSALEGPPVLPSRNLALLPFFTNWGIYRVDTNTGRAVFSDVAPTPYFTNLPHLRTDTIHNFPGVESFDLAAWQRYFQHGTADMAKVDPAQSVLQALESVRPILDALSAARDAMPAGEFRREYGGKGAMGYDSFQSLAELKLNLTLLLRASAESAAGQAPEALHDVETALWLHRATCGEPPALLPFMLGVALLSEVKVPIEKGLATGGWNEDELAQLQGELAHIDLLADYNHAMRGERAWFLERLDQTWPDPFPVQTRPANRHWIERLLLFVAAYGPRGWLDENKTALADWHEELLTTCNPTTHRIDEARHRVLFQREREHLSPLDFGSYILRSAAYFLEPHLAVAADGQTQVDELVVRCALTRYALAHASHNPATLSELVPKYIGHVPTGIVDGAPMRYQTTAGGRYLLGTGSLEQK